MACVMIASGLASTGCDPNGPGAKGEIRLASSIMPGEFKTLELRANPNSGDTFDATNPVFPTESEWSVSDDLSKITFPYSYEIDGGIGTTSNRDWRIFAWLSADGSSEIPKSGEPFGTNTFAIAECGPAVKGYCGVTEEVDVTINRSAP
jgi:hypothetical protein